MTDDTPRCSGCGAGPKADSHCSAAPDGEHIWPDPPVQYRLPAPASTDDTLRALLERLIRSAKGDRDVALEGMQTPHPREYAWESGVHYEACMWISRLDREIELLR